MAKGSIKVGDIVLRVDDDTVTIGGKDLGITVKTNTVRLVTSHVAPKRKTPLIDKRT